MRRWFSFFPERWQGVLIAELIGIPTMLFLLTALPDYWKPLALVPPLIVGIAGFVLGATVSDN